MNYINPHDAGVVIRSSCLFTSIFVAGRFLAPISQQLLQGLPGSPLLATFEMSIQHLGESQRSDGVEPNRSNCLWIIETYWLVVSTVLKNMKVNGKDDNPYMKWKIIQMFETTNQNILYKTVDYPIRGIKLFNMFFSPPTMGIYIYI